MDNYLDRLIDSQFPRPTNNIFFRFFIEIPFSKGKWIKRMEKLRNIGDVEPTSPRPYLWIPWETQSNRTLPVFFARKSFIFRRDVSFYPCQISC